jgi:hypothetical protein
MKPSQWQRKQHSRDQDIADECVCACFEDSRVDPLTRPSADGHPLPQGGEG